jgi:hypothetical protein
VCERLEGALFSRSPTVRGQHTDRLVPALTRGPASAGTLNLAHPTDGEAMLVVLWISAEQAERSPGARSLEIGQALAAIAAIASDHEPRPLDWDTHARI